MTATITSLRQLGDIELSHLQIIFSSVVILVALSLLLVIRIAVRRRLKGRLERLEEIEHFDAVQTESPHKDPLREALRHAKRSIKSRYSVINRMATGLLFAVAILFASLPALDTLPRAIVSLLVAIAAAVLGIAARPFVENLISGVVISFSNQLRIGDTVLLENDLYGTVEDITITHTVIKLWDWRRHIVSNSVMLQKDFTNLSHKDQHLWAHVEFHVDYEADLDVVEHIAIEAAKQSRYHADYESPQMWVRSLNTATIVIWVAAWAKSPEDAWELRADIRKNLVRGFQKRGIHSQLERIEVAKKIVANDASSS